MAKVKDIIATLSQRDPEEVVALEGWWYKSDVENNNEVELTPEQWQFIVERFEDNTHIHISNFVSEALNEEDED
jgi:hypothetical protein